jgi:hypothetical protein
LRSEDLLVDISWHESEDMAIYESLVHVWENVENKDKEKRHNNVQDLKIQNTDGQACSNVVRHGSKTDFKSWQSLSEVFSSGFLLWLVVFFFWECFFFRFWLSVLQFVGCPK